MQDMGAHSNAYRDDEIDLRELIKGLWAQKVLISSVTALVAADALAYVPLATPVYETKATVLPPLLSDIAPYNVGRREASLTLFSTEKVYALFTRSLNSQSLARGFFREVYIPSLPESVRAEPEDQLWDRFNQQLSTKAPNKQRPELPEISMQHSDPRLAADWVDQFVSNASILRPIDTKPDNVAVFTLDSPAALPQTPIKPKKTLILASGLILGGMLGLFAALLRNMLRVKPGACRSNTVTARTARSAVIIAAN